MAKQGIRFLFLGDLVGIVGQQMLRRWYHHLVEKYSVDATIINGENIASKGRGITDKIANNVFDLGVRVITTGNHVWAQRDIYNYINQESRLIRPANFPDGTPGKGMVTIDVKGTGVTIINIMGQTFFRETLSCPFRKLDELVAQVKMKSPIVFVDFHAEATSEKMALALYADGRISGLFGTHTHIPTADERVLPNGTAYVTDLGSSISLNSSLGMHPQQIIQRFITQMPQQFEVDTRPPYIMTGVVVDVDRLSGKALHIERVSVQDEELIK